MIGNRLEGDGTWPWLVATVEGKDIRVESAVATWFGGPNDPSDTTGDTASGINLLTEPDYLGCSLPMRTESEDDSPLTAGSPIPPIPWQTTVRVYCLTTNTQITVPVIDIGPAKATGHGLDLTEAAFEALGLDPAAGTAVVSYRILGGAGFVVD
jgi:hypothetical protein